VTRTYTSQFSVQGDVTYCWEGGGVPSGILLSPTTDAKDKTSYGQVLIVGAPEWLCFRLPVQSLRNESFVETFK